MAKPETISQAMIKRLLPKHVSKIVDRWYKTRTADCIVVSFPKSGRTWLRVMLSAYFAKMHGFAEYETLGFENLHLKNPQVPKIFFTHDASYKARPDQLKKDKSVYKNHKLVYLVRDPRDVIVSLYFHRTRRDKDLDMPMIDFVLGEQGGLETVIEFYNIWSVALPTIPAALVLRYEDLRADSLMAMKTLLEFLEVEINEKVLVDVIQETSFSKMKENERSGAYDRGLLRAGDSSDTESYKVRRGKVGGYSDYFSPEEAGKIDGLVRQKLDPVYGYC